VGTWLVKGTSDVILEREAFPKNLKISNGDLSSSDYQLIERLIF
jgi:hypothetical protein